MKEKSRWHTVVLPAVVAAAVTAALPLVGQVQCVVRFVPPRDAPPVEHLVVAAPRLFGS